MGKLAITGGEPSRKKRFDAWPIYTEKERRALEDVLTNHNWGGQPFPGNRIAYRCRRQPKRRVRFERAFCKGLQRRTPGAERLREKLFVFRSRQKVECEIERRRFLR